MSVNSFDDVLTIVVNQCADYLETEKYLLPSEKHCLLRVMPYVLFLMDGDQNSQNNIFKSKKLKLPRFAALFKVCTALAV
jgi:cytoplasmic FMR1 interacting protein